MEGACIGLWSLVAVGGSGLAIWFAVICSTAAAGALPLWFAVICFEKHSKKSCQPLLRVPGVRRIYSEELMSLGLQLTYG
jgi:hypothetical protein